MIGWVGGLSETEKQKCAIIFNKNDWQQGWLIGLAGGLEIVWCNQDYTLSDLPAAAPILFAAAAALLFAAAAADESGMLS